MTAQKLNWYHRIMFWFTDLFSNSAVRDAFSTAATMVDHFLPIVTAIEADLKPGLKDDKQSNLTVLYNFLKKHAEGSEELSDEIASIFDKPYGYIISSVALILAKRLAPDQATNILRLAIEAAYTLYKATKK